LVIASLEQLKHWCISLTGQIQKKQKEGEKKRHSLSTIQAHSGIVVSAVSFGEQKLQLAFKNLHTI
jgi:hypothetical protein